jgi:hypothetical protein
MNAMVSLSACISLMMATSHRVCSRYASLSRSGSHIVLDFQPSARRIARRRADRSLLVRGRSAPIVVSVACNVNRVALRANPFQAKHMARSHDCAVFAGQQAGDREHEYMRTIFTMPALVLTAASVPAERVVTGDGVTAATIAGAKGTLRIDPAGTSMPIVTSDFAERAGLKKGFIAIGYAVGPERVKGSTDVASIGLGAEPFKRRIAWTPLAFTPAADGVIGPGGVPEPVVRFVLGPARAGERTVTLPMMTQGGVASGWGERYARIDVGGEPMRVRFDPHHPRTLATAAAAARIATAQGGTLSGAPRMTEIAFGIERPVRDMTLARALTVGPLAVLAMGVRTGDVGSAAAIREQDGDPDEVIVAAGKKRDPSRDRLSIGADLLSRCSSLVFDKPAKLIRLTC